MIEGTTVDVGSSYPVAMALVLLISGELCTRIY